MEARGAHNPEAGGSKPLSARFFANVVSSFPGDMSLDVIHFFRMLAHPPTSNYRLPIPAQPKK